MELVLIGLVDRGQRVQLGEELDAVVGLNMVETIAEHFQKSVQDTPGMGLEHIR